MSIYKSSESPYRKLTFIPTGYANLDRLLGGGVATRKIYEFSGPYSVGKTTLALSIVAEAQKMGMKCLYADAEFSFDENYAASLGVQTDKLEILTERHAEGILDAIEEWAESHKDSFIILDSVGGLLPRAELEKGSEGKVIGGQAKLIAVFCRKMTVLLALNNIALLVLNHEFTDILSGKLKTSGGAKLEYAKSVWLRLRKANKRVMSGEVQVGDIIEAEIRKNKLANTMKQSCELQLLYGKGFEKSFDLLEAAKEKLFEKKGQFYFFEGEKVARGDKGLRELFKDEAFTQRVKAAL